MEVNSMQRKIIFLNHGDYVVSDTFGSWQENIDFEVLEIREIVSMLIQFR